MSIESSVMEAGSASTVGNVNIGQKRNKVLGTLDRVVGSSNVQRRLPAPVARIHVGFESQQSFNRILVIKSNEKQLKT
jgi:hypothetical protein